MHTWMHGHTYACMDERDKTITLLATRGVRNPMKISDISFLKTELTSKFKNRKLGFRVSVFRKPTSAVLWQFFTLFHSQFILQHHRINSHSIFKPPPPVGAGGGYMFLGRPSVPVSVRASVRPSVIYVVVLCFRDISPVSVDGFSPTFCHWCILGHRWPYYIFGS